MSKSISKKETHHPQFRVSHNSIPQHFSYFNPYKQYEQQQRKPTRVLNLNFQRNLRQILQLSEQSPGPGNYDISLPIVKPKYSTIIKNNNSIILKLNDTVQGTSSFKSKLDRFRFHEQKSPGPGFYSQSINSRLNSQQREKHKQKMGKSKQLQKKLKQQYIKSILRREKVETIKNYVVFEQQRIQKKRIARYSKQLTSDSHHSLQQSLYQKQKSINSGRSRLPLARSLNKSMKIERQGFPVFYAPSGSKDEQIQSKNQQSYVDSYRDLYVGVANNQLRMSIDSQIKFSNTFYNRQMLDVILRRKADPQNYGQNSGLLNISETSREHIATKSGIKQVNSVKSSRQINSETQL